LSPRGPTAGEWGLVCSLPVLLQQRLEAGVVAERLAVVTW